MAVKAKKKVIRKKKKKIAIPKKGKAFISATYNNTIVTLADATGNVLAWSSSGKVGFKGPKKSTAYAASMVVKDAATQLVGSGFKEVEVFVKGVGTGREAAIRALNANGLEVTAIKDVTPIPHNGCRPKKPRRL